MPWGNQQPEIPLPDWLQLRPPKVVPPPESKALQIAQYDVVFLRVLENICKGDTLAKAVRELPIEVDSGSFFRWVKKDRTRYDLYKEAKEVAAEVYAGRMIDIAENTTSDGEPAPPEDISRSKLKFDIYKWLTERYNRKDYGDTKTIDINTSISVRTALDEARGRAAQIIDVDAEEATDAVLFLQSAALSTASEDDDDA